MVRIFQNKSLLVFQFSYTNVASRSNKHLAIKIHRQIFYNFIHSFALKLILLYTAFSTKVVSQKRKSAHDYANWYYG